MQYRRIPKVIFQLHGLAPFCFPPSWFFFSDQYNRGALLSAKCKNVSVVSVAKKCKTSVGTRPRKMITNILNVILDTKSKKMEKD